MLELGFQGGCASDDSGWSYNPAAAVQALTAETQVCTCHRVTHDVTNQPHAHEIPSFYTLFPVCLFSSPFT